MAIVKCPACGSPARTAGQSPTWYLEPAIDRGTLETLIDAAQDTYSRHMQELGATTPKNKRWAEEMKRAIERARKAVNEL